MSESFSKQTAACAKESPQEKGAVSVLPLHRRNP